MRIGVISDTHNYLDPRVPKLLSGVEHILHGGDIGAAKLIWELERIAPVTAVLGNTDDPGLHFRLTESIELGGRKFLLHHIVSPHALSDELSERIGRERPDVVVFGHTHKRFCESIGGTLFFNPGYAGHSRFNMPRSLAILEINGKEIRPKYLNLDGLA